MELIYEWFVISCGAIFTATVCYGVWLWVK